MYVLTQMLTAEFKPCTSNSAGTPNSGCATTNGRRAPEIPCKTVTASWSSGFGTLQTFPKSTESAKTWLKSKTKGRSTFFCILISSEFVYENTWAFIHACTSVGETRSQSKVIPKTPKLVSRKLQSFYSLKKQL